MSDYKCDKVTELSEKMVILITIRIAKANAICNNTDNNTKAAASIRNISRRNLSKIILFKEGKHMSVITITKNNFQEEVLNSEKPVLLDFWATWCGPCRMVSPIVDEIADERSDIKVGKINVDEEPELAGQFNVMSIPTLIVIKNGKIANQAVGARPKDQILALL